MHVHLYVVYLCITMCDASSRLYVYYAGLSTIQCISLRTNYCVAVTSFSSPLAERRQPASYVRVKILLYKIIY